MTKRMRKNLRRAAVALIGLALAGVAVQFVVLPMLLRRQIETVLAEAGLRNVSFSIPSATLWSARVVNLRFPNSPDHIGQIELGYRLGRLRDGVVDSLRIDGLSWTLRVAENGKVDLGAAAPLFAPRQPTATSPAATTPGSQPPPVTRIQLASSELLIVAPHEKFKLALSGQALASGSGYQVNLRTQLGGDVQIGGTVSATGSDVKLELAADEADARQVTALLTAFAPHVDIGVVGNVKTRTTFAWTNKRGSVHLELQAKGGEPPAGPGGPNLQLLGGVFHLTGEFGDGAENFQLNAKDVSFSQRSQSLKADGVSGAVTLTDLAPLSSPPGQHVKVNRVTAGEMEFNDGIVEFQVTGPQTIQVQRTQWSVLGGKLLANDFTIKGDQVALTLRAEDLDMKQLLAVFAKDEVDGTGAVSGQVQLAMRGSQITFGAGRLSAIRNGGLQIHNAEELTGAAPKNPQSVQQQVQGGVTEALKDFVYDSLTAELKQTPTEGLFADVRIEGHGRTGARFPLSYEPRIHHLDDLIRVVLGVRSAISDVQNRKSKEARP